jgi:hypothetical protein
MKTEHRANAGRGRRLFIFRVMALMIPLFVVSGCFQVMHVLDWKDDGAMDVQWTFRFSRALEEAQQGQGAEKGKGLSEMMETQKKELPDSLKGLVKNLKFEAIENDYDSGMVVSFLVPDYRNFPFDKMKNDDFPLVPRYLPAKKQVVFHFEPVKKLNPENPDAVKKEGTGDAPAEGGSSGTGGEGGDQMNEMGKQISRLFLSSVRYQIFLGRKFNVDRVVIKKAKEEKKISVQRIGDISLIDLPLFAMFGDNQEPFDMVIHLK